MEEFVHKTVSDSITLDRAKAGPIECVCIRSRTSNGVAAIELRINGSVALQLSTTTYGDGYEQAAVQIADLLRRMAENPCRLPSD